MTSNNPEIEAQQLSLLRQKLRHARTQLSSHERTNLDQIIQQQLKKWVILAKPQSIGLYMPFNGEPDVRPLVAWLRSHNIKLATPVVNALHSGQMQFHQWLETTQFQKNKFGISEPQNSQVVEPDEIEVLLAPLVAFNSTGTRLGMGGGYYDRWLAKANTRPQIVGIAYELQRIENIPRRDWDIPLDQVITEKGRFSFA